MEQHYQHSSSVDYSLKEGETLVLQIKNNVCESASSVGHETFSFFFSSFRHHNLYTILFIVFREVAAI
jgi:hypothetical protein